MNEQILHVDGMTCGHCASAVTDELASAAGTTDITVDLTAGGTSTVTISGGRRLSVDEAATALAEAGNYTLHAA